MSKKVDRITKIKKKFGSNAFERWGKLGGSPILADFKAGKLKRVK